MKHAPSRWLSLGFLVLSGLGCRGPELDEEALAGGLGSDPEGCRSFATLGSVDVGAGSAELRCGFDSGSAEQRCEWSAGGERVSSVTEYASLADFVEAGHTLGKLTSLGETFVENGRERHVRHRYDELGRLVRSLEEAPDRSRVTAYADYDGDGRPRRATEETSGVIDDCGVWLVSIEYADALRTVSRRARPREPGRCGFTERTIIERFDGAGNRVSVVAADGAGVRDSFVARHASSTARVCL
jgi:hypothetical protein